MYFTKEETCVAPLWIGQRVRASCLGSRRRKQQRRVTQTFTLLLLSTYRRPRVSAAYLPPAEKQKPSFPQHSGRCNPHLFCNHPRCFAFHCIMPYCAWRNNTEMLISATICPRLRRVLFDCVCMQNPKSGNYKRIL